MTALYGMGNSLTIDSCVLAQMFASITPYAPSNDTARSWRTWNVCATIRKKSHDCSPFWQQFKLGIAVAFEWSLPGSSIHLTVAMEREAVVVRLAAFIPVFAKSNIYSEREEITSGSVVHTLSKIYYRIGDTKQAFNRDCRQMSYNRNGLDLPR
ncbi:hypothetical protein FHW16_005801 [Phyllobacterium myrsinacearum]|uniref:Uncharacterized protein n=1 Tax=Phyllobacterium myrsinacearum TaxID=28101 RepID=A0A839EN83_9HYPH|nr:hypothetical protein [Phyllobacterium myrsinacearum]